MDINQTITITDLPAGEYDVTVEYSGDNVFSNATAYANFTVNKITTEVIPDNETIDLFVDEEYKIDVFEQLEFNWDRFIEYLWNEYCFGESKDEIE